MTDTDTIQRLRALVYQQGDEIERLRRRLAEHRPGQPAEPIALAGVTEFRDGTVTCDDCGAFLCRGEGDDGPLEDCRCGEPIELADSHLITMGQTGVWNPPHESENQLSDRAPEHRPERPSADPCPYCDDPGCTYMDHGHGYEGELEQDRRCGTCLSRSAMGGYCIEESSEYYEAVVPTWGHPCPHWTAKGGG